MAILAVDTSADETSCCIRANGRNILKVNSKTQSHAESLFSLIESALNEASLNIKDISSFVIITGPGSYTGVRIGLSALKGFAFASGRPLLGVSKFQLLAHKYFLEKEYAVCFDAKRNEVFVQRFRSENNTVTELSQPELYNLDEVQNISEKKIVLESESKIFESQNDYNDSYIKAKAVAASEAAEYIDLLMSKNKLEGLIAAPLYIRKTEYVKSNIRNNNVQ